MRFITQEYFRVNGIPYVVVESAEWHDMVTHRPGSLIGALLKGELKIIGHPQMSQFRLDVFYKKAGISNRRVTCTAEL